MAVTITAADLRAIAPGAAPAIVDGIVKHQALLARYGVNAGAKARQRVAHFFAHCATETQGFTRLEENLYYTTAARLRAVWPSRFPNAAAAQPFLRNPEKLANSVYANRLGNGPPSSGDGWRYRGSGGKQTTGKANYQAVERATGLPVVKNPEMLRRFPEALESACIYWRDNNLNRFADAGDVAGLTRAIQGGTGGLADRRIYTERALKVRWGSAGPLQSAATKDPVLRNGARGNDVRQVQQLLAAHGFDPGRIDGIFGDGTERAVRDFQSAKGLMADGVVGPATWPALRAEPAPAEKPVEPPRPPEAPTLPDDPPEPAPAPGELDGSAFWKVAVVVVVIIIALLFGVELF